MQERNSDLTKMNILLAAEEDFAKAGLYGARINVIAENAGANKRMIYHYYGSKEGLYQKVLEYNLKKIAALGGRDALSGRDLEEGVREIVSRYYWFLHDNPRYVKIIAWEDLLASPYNKKTLKEILTPVFNQVFDFYARGCETGLFRKDLDILQLMFSVHAMCFITFAKQDILLGMENGSSTTLEKRLEHILDVVISALKA